VIFYYYYFITECGVFAKKRIPKDCRFGPLEGKLCHVEDKESNLVLIIKTNEGEVLVDTSDDGIEPFKNVTFGN
jgi:hypothetical protein